MAQVLTVALAQPVLFRDQLIAQAQGSGLEPRKGHVASGPVQQRARQVKAALAPMRGLGLDRGAAGLRQGQQLGDLVEGFAGGIVDRAAQTREILRAVDAQELAMPARDQQHQIGIVDAVGQARRQRVPRQMVHADQRQPGSGGDALGAHHTRHHPADQPRPRGDGDPVQVGQLQARLNQRLFDA